MGCNYEVAYWDSEKWVTTWEGNEIFAAFEEMNSLIICGMESIRLIYRPNKEG
jgi:hypothetical protein